MRRWASEKADYIACQGPPTFRWLRRKMVARFDRHSSNSSAPTERRTYTPFRQLDGPLGTSIPFDELLLAETTFILADVLDGHKNKRPAFRSTALETAFPTLAQQQSREPHKIGFKLFVGPPAASLLCEIGTPWRSCRRRTNASEAPSPRGASG